MNSIKGSREFIRTTATTAIIVATLFGIVRLESLSAEEASKSDSQADTKNVALKYQCIVVEKETGRAISNARINVRFTANDSKGYRFLGEANYISDPDGQYQLIIPAELTAIEVLEIERDIEHDDYAAMKGSRLPLNLVRNPEQPEARSHLEKAELFAAEAVTGVVVSPDGKPVSGINVKGYSRSGIRPDRETLAPGSFNDCVTDRDGRFRMNLHKNAEGIIWIIPKEFAPVEKFIAKKRGDLGEFKLIPGVRVNGRVLGIKGNPLPSVVIHISINGRRNNGDLRITNSIQRVTFTDAEGRFELDPLPPGDYSIGPSIYFRDQLVRDFTVHAIPDVFSDQRITIKDSEGTQSITIQAVPHAIISGRLSDSNGEKHSDSRFSIGGQFDRTLWSTTTRTDQGGVFSVWIPHGLQNTYIEFVSDRKQAWRFRRNKDEPLQNRLIGGAKLGTVTDDVEDFEVVFYKSPVVQISAVDEEQKLIPGFRAIATYPWGRQQALLKGGLRSDLYFEDLPDGRTRTQQMIPDEEVTFKLTAPGFEPASQTVKLAEGETQELIVTMKKDSGEIPKVESGKN